MPLSEADCFNYPEISGLKLFLDTSRPMTLTPAWDRSSGRPAKNVAVQNLSGEDYLPSLSPITCNMKIWRHRHGEQNSDPSSATDIHIYLGGAHIDKSLISLVERATRTTFVEGWKSLNPLSPPELPNIYFLGSGLYINPFLLSNPEGYFIHPDAFTDTNAVPDGIWRGTWPNIYRLSSNKNSDFFEVVIGKYISPNIVNQLTNIIYGVKLHTLDFAKLYETLQQLANQQKLDPASVLNYTFPYLKAEMI